ncbi:MAG: zinc-ribbon domain-containing protein, partial [Acutalibacteraceae bacterium]|nr:zinc-ribbon domain-containing protein [Acutalibacteraceae bacterium]
MSFCPVCGSELKPEATTCPVCGTSVAVQPQPPVNTHPPKKAKKKKKNLGIKITAA